MTNISMRNCKRLRKENARLKEEREILKKAAASFAQQLPCSTPGCSSRRSFRGGGGVGFWRSRAVATMSGSSRPPSAQADADQQVQAKGFCRNVHLTPFGVCSPVVTDGTERESDDGSELQGGPFSQGHHPHGRALVCRVSPEHAPCRRTYGRTQEVSWSNSTINRWVVTYSPQLEEAFHRRKRPVWVQLAPGRNLHSCQRPVAVSVSCGQQVGQDHRFFAYRAPGYSSGASVFEESHPPPWSPRDDHH